MERSSIDVYLSSGSFLESLTQDVRLGLTSHPKSLPSKYFYDSEGSALFQRITQLPEYYLTRVEQGLITSLAQELMDTVRPQEIIELGPGSTSKIRLLLDAESTSSHLIRYVPFDLDGQIVQCQVKTLVESYPLLQVHGVVGDFEKHLGHLPSPIGRRLVIF